MDEWGIYKKNNKELIDVLRLPKALLCEQASLVAIREALARLLERLEEEKDEI